MAEAEAEVAVAEPEKSHVRMKLMSSVVIVNFHETDTFWVSKYGFTDFYGNIAV